MNPTFASIAIAGPEAVLTAGALFTLMLGAFGGGDVRLVSGAVGWGAVGPEMGEPGIGVGHGALVVRELIPLRQVCSGEEWVRG